ncbi:aromatic amino acid aminotransferase 1 [Myriangium duriaei CBS 260.36]|uniref:aromatic-amino-acid transaminase n=1 Tax=Myriangium duriaei CBS 260.36 TaxID=1168546 RepID=A0A9P4MJW3_9PEZI|nr:aromatic amino acid aminotransferase 1 [Myriangium duriaei CBS 260.36]
MAPPGMNIEVTAETDTTGITIPEPLTIAGIGKRRTAAGRLIAGVAAASDVEAFKGRGRHAHKPLSKRWDHHLTKESAGRVGNRLKEAAKFLGTPGIISLGGGLPSSEYFPFDEMSLKLPTGQKFSAHDIHTGGTTVTAGKHDLSEGTSLFDISTALNYGQGTGSAQLLRFIIEHTELVHNPPYRDWQCTMTIGSTSSLDMALRMFLNYGDYIITEEYTFSAAVETARQMGGRLLSIPIDEQGLLPDEIDQVLSSWDPVARNARKPHLLYTVPSGQNPTGATMSTQRRRDLYAVAQKHDLIILEDEPYYFLQMQPYTGPNAPDVPLPASVEDFVRSLVPSLLSMDTDGRVMRLDSFSKVIAPGSRIGWITASEQLVERYIRHADLSTQGPSGFSQLALFKLLDEHWGHEGYLRWLLHIRAEYTRRRDVMLAACEEHLPREIVSWVPPMAGMFHWLKIDWTRHPAFGTKTVEQVENDIFLAAIDKGALIMPGSYFYADNEVEHDTMFFRATYAAAPFDKIVEAVRRFGDAIREEFGLVEKRVTNGNGHAH